MSFDDRLARYKIEDVEDWREWVGKVPKLKFPAGWEIKIIPPFGGALVRFIVTTKAGGSTSVYLDVNDSLGAMGEPYWEVHPYNGDTYRCLIDETTKLIRAIKHSLKEREKL